MQPVKTTHGGKRRGAGRPRCKYRLDAPHRSREIFERPSAIHVTMRCRKYQPDLRIDRVFGVLRAVLGRYVEREDFRVVHFSIQDSHIHMIAEASNSRAFEHGMRSLTINTARAINNAFTSPGAPVLFRYHSTVIKTKRYARNAIAYVLGNWRRHSMDFANGRMLPAILDRYSSAVSFNGWAKTFRAPAGYTPLPVSEPRTFLLRVGWAYDGPLDPYAVPGPQWW